jgi:hypothetical protein
MRITTFYYLFLKEKDNKSRNEDNNDYLMEQFEDKKEELDEITIRKFNTYVNRVEEPKTVQQFIIFL